MHLIDEAKMDGQATAGAQLSEPEAAWLRGLLSNPGHSAPVTDIPMIYGLMVKLGMVGGREGEV